MKNSSVNSAKLLISNRQTQWESLRNLSRCECATSDEWQDLTVAVDGDERKCRSGGFTEVTEGCPGPQVSYSPRMLPYTKPTPPKLHRESCLTCTSRHLSRIS